MEKKKTKICPYCGEEIMASAIKCRYCGEWLVNRDNEVNESKKEGTPSNESGIDREYDSSQQTFENDSSSASSPKFNKNLGNGNDHTSYAQTKPVNAVLKNRPMSFKEAVKLCFHKWNIYEGRASRSEFWYFVLFCVLADFLLYGIFVLLEVVFFIGLANDAVWFSKGILYFGIILTLAFVLVLELPTLAVSVRRLHDVGKSGWYLLIGLIPLVGIVVMIYFFVLDSDVGNMYGERPSDVSELNKEMVVTNKDKGITIAVSAIILLFYVLTYFAITKGLHALGYPNIEELFDGTNKTEEEYVPDDGSDTYNVDTTVDQYDDQNSAENETSSESDVNSDAINNENEATPLEESPSTNFEESDALPIANVGGNSFSVVRDDEGESVILIKKGNEILKQYKTNAYIDRIVDKKLVNGNLYFIGEQSNCGMGYLINVVVYRINTEDNNASCIDDGCAEAKFSGDFLKVNHPSVANQATATCEAEYRYKDHWNVLRLK